MSNRKFIADLESIIIKIYEEGVSLDEAEKLAGRFLHAQLQVSALLKVEDLSARMRKSGLKAIKAAVYTNACKGVDKKPTEAMLAAIVDSDELVGGEQNAFDTAEVERDEFERLYNVYREAHIFLRGVSKGRFDG